MFDSKETFPLIPDYSEQLKRIERHAQDAARWAQISGIVACMILGFLVAGAWGK